MEFNEFQEHTHKYANNKTVNGDRIQYLFLCLQEEVGEMATHFKDVHESGGEYDNESISLIKSELSDILYCISEIARNLELTLDDVVVYNTEKLKQRNGER
jgi:NTP pyrophosphatase (non-canonical NTP hydrolase)